MNDCTTGIINELGGCEPQGCCEAPLPVNREPFAVEPPDLGRCLDGTTEFGFLDCEMDAVGPPPTPPYVGELPATGLGEVLVAGALGLLAAGIVIRGIANIRHKEE